MLSATLQPCHVFLATQACLQLPCTFWEVAASPSGFSTNSHEVLNQRKPPLESRLVLLLWDLEGDV